MPNWTAASAMGASSSPSSVPLNCGRRSRSISAASSWVKLGSSARIASGFSWAYSWDSWIAACRRSNRSGSSAMACSVEKYAEAAIWSPGARSS
jgi:hypothetical protein